MSDPWLAMSMDSMAAGAAWSSGGSVVSAGGKAVWAKETSEKKARTRVRKSFMGWHYRRGSSDWQTGLNSNERSIYNTSQHVGCCITDGRTNVRYGPTMPTETATKRTATRRKNSDGNHNEP